MVIAMYNTASLSPYAYFSAKGRIMVLEIMGGREDRNLLLRMRYVITAPIKVARLPKMTSITAEPVMIFEIIHPINNPGTAALVKHGRMHKASDNRSWITPDERPKRDEIIVSTT